MVRSSLFVGLLAVFLAALAGCGHKESRRRPFDHLPHLETVSPARTVLPIRIELAATVEPLEKAELCARVPGVVKYLPAEIDIGRRISAGEKLIELDVPDLEAQRQHKEALLKQVERQEQLSQESVRVAEREVVESEKQERRYVADFEYAKAQHARVAEMVKRNSLTPEQEQEKLRQLEAARAAWDASKASIDTKKARLEASKADLQVAQSKVEVARAELHHVTELIGLASVRAPFNGVITKRWVDRGMTIKDAGMPLLTVMNTDTVRVLLDIPERHVPLVSALEQANPAGQRDPVELRINSLRETPCGGVFTGTITRLSGALDPATRTMRTEVHLDNRDGHLRPGMYGTARVLLAERSYVLTLPSTALVRRGDEVGVYYVDNLAGTPPRGVVKWAQVDLGLDDGLHVEIRASRPELDGSAQIIAKGNGAVREGDTVLPIVSKRE